MRRQKAFDEEAAQASVRALADPQRYKIVKMLAGCADGSQCSAILEQLDVTPPTLSHHMKELRDAGLVHEQRTGRTVQYTLHRENVAAFLEGMGRCLLTPCPLPRLD